MKKGFPLLLQDLHSCTICEAEIPFGPHPVVQLHPKTSILIAVQAPGKKVHVTGIPFTNPSGSLLRKWLGVDQDTFYDAQRIAILSMEFYYPGTGKSGDLPHRPEYAGT